MNSMQAGVRMNAEQNVKKHWARLIQNVLRMDAFVKLKSEKYPK